MARLGLRAASRATPRLAFGSARLARQTILPAILEEVVSCHDVIAQEYLMEIIIQVFHDDLHLRTLDQFLSATAQLQRAVNVKQIVISLVDRFAAYAARSREEEESRRKDVLRKAQAEGGDAVEKLKEEFGEKPLTGVPDDVKLFDVFWTQIAELVRVGWELSECDEGIKGLTGTRFRAPRISCLHVNFFVLDLPLEYSPRLRLGS